MPSEVYYRIIEEGYHSVSLIRLCWNMPWRDGGDESRRMPSITSGALTIGMVFIYKLKKAAHTAAAFCINHSVFQQA